LIRRLAAQVIEPAVLLAAVDKARDWYWADAARHKSGRADLRGASARIVEMAFEACGCTAPEGLARRIGDAYRDGREAAIAPFPGAIETLEELQKRNIPLALITNGDAVVQRTKVERFELAGYFGHILIEGEFGFGKPEPEVYLAAMMALGAEPAGTWCVGDNLEWEVAAPQALGLHAVWHDFAGRGLPAGSTVKPDYIINRLSDLLEL
jgi:putative hydrolase of the HAD superfamily